MIPPNLRSAPKLLFLALLFSAAILVPAFYFLSETFESSSEHNQLWASGSVGRNLNPFAVNLSEKEGGGNIMGKMGNETAKRVLPSRYILSIIHQRYQVERKTKGKSQPSLILVK